MPNLHLLLFVQKSCKKANRGFLNFKTYSKISEDQLNEEASNNTQKMLKRKYLLHETIYTLDQEVLQAFHTNK